MNYTYNRHLPNVGIDDAEMRVRHVLQELGFGVLTEIDVKETLKHKIDVEICPSSYKVGHQIGLSTGGSGSFV